MLAAMSYVVRPDLATRYYQLTAYTTQSGDTTTRAQPWGSDANGPRSPVGGILVTMPSAADWAANVTGTSIEVGGPDITPGNSPNILHPGDSILCPAPNAASLWIIASAAGLQVRGIVQ